LPWVGLALLLGLGSTVGSTVGGAVVVGAEGVEWNYQSLEDSGKFCPERDSCRSVPVF
jgi:hypothetical protein